MAMKTGTLERELLAQFVGEHQEAAFCFRCLAEMMGVARSRVIDAADRLRSAGELEVAGSRCAGCSRAEVVVRRPVLGELRAGGGW
jgi:hypothetical protein